MRLKQAESLEEVLRLVKTGFCRGAVTNNFLGEAEYRRALGRGCLSLGEWEGGFAVFRRRRQGCSQMWFTLLSQEGEACPLPEVPLVTEIPLRPGGGPSARAVDYWTERGFSLALRRVRLRLGQDVLPLSAGFFSVAEAEEKDLPAVARFLEASFDPITGCLPEPEELSASRVFCLWDDGRLGGVLHAGEAPGRWEIRHLAVEERLRGTGAAQALFSAYRNACPRGRHLVWTGEENRAALRFYEKCGYAADGWTSAVLRYDPGEGTIETGKEETP